MGDNMAEKENEITVKLKWGLDETKLNFVNKGVRLITSFILNDTYLIKKEIDINEKTNLEILSQAIILREVDSAHPEKVLIYKDKKYDNKGKLVESQRYSCPIVDVDKTHDLLEAIGYKDCFNVEQECLEYEMSGTNIYLEYIPDIGLFLELENNNKSKDELVEMLHEFGVAYYENDYFVKKASLMLDKIRKQRR